MTKTLQETANETLPAGSAASLELVSPTESEQRQQTIDNGSGTTWPGALDLSAYLAREKMLSKREATKDGGLSHWILVDSAAKPSTDRLNLAGCDTIRRRALVCHEGEVKETICHAIGSVFCPPAGRGRGYGVRMMRELGEKLRTHQRPEGADGVFSVLYSDIGKKFYARFCWQCYSSSHVHLPPNPSPAPSTNPAITLTPLRLADLPTLCATDEANLRATLAARPLTAPTAVVILPDAPCMDWHHAREDFVAQHLHARKPDLRGALATYTSVSGATHRVWAIWVRMWYNADASSATGNSMYILRIAADPPIPEHSKGVDGEGEGEGPGDGEGSAVETQRAGEALAEVLKVAQREAHEWKMGEVEMWNADAVTLAACARLLEGGRVEVVEREEESIACLRFYGMGREGDGNWDGHGDGGRVEWLANEKFAWC